MYALFFSVFFFTFNVLRAVVHTHFCRGAHSTLPSVQSKTTLFFFFPLVRKKKKRDGADFALYKTQCRARFSLHFSLHTMTHEDLP
uniref:Secreted protein n=1 Tax=Rhipicephalus appendiculatus TaxID=34631 RepID=A0A131YE27_RHIAP